MTVEEEKNEVIDEYRALQLGVYGAGDTDSGVYGAGDALVSTEWGIKVHATSGEDLQKMPFPTAPVMVEERQKDELLQIANYAEPPVLKSHIHDVASRLCYLVTNKCGLAGELSKAEVDKESLRRSIVKCIGGGKFDIDERKLEEAVSQVADGELGLTLTSSKRHLQIGEVSLKWGGREIRVDNRNPDDGEPLPSLEPRNLASLPQELSEPCSIILPLEEEGKLFHDKFGNKLHCPFGCIMVVRKSYALCDVVRREDRSSQPYLQIDLESHFCPKMGVAAGQAKDPAA
ncbi:MAG: hypothetical protein SGARI_003119, partial [Bacillariaceae sp.]